MQCRRQLRERWKLPEPRGEQRLAGAVARSTVRRSPGKHASAALVPQAPTCARAWAAHELPAPAAASQQRPRRESSAPQAPLCPSAAAYTSCALRCRVRTRCTMDSLGEPIPTPKALAAAPGLCHDLPARAAGACRARGARRSRGVTHPAGRCPAREPWGGGTEPSRAGFAPNHVPTGITTVAWHGLGSRDVEGGLPSCSGALSPLPTSAAPTHTHTHLWAASPRVCSLLAKKCRGGLPRCKAVLTHEQPPRDAHHSVAPRLCHHLHTSTTPAVSGSLSDPDTPPTLCLSKCCCSSTDTSRIC